MPGLPRLPEARNLTNLLDARETDAVMTDYFNFLFLKGHPAHRGDKVLASFVHHQPGYSRQGNLRLPAAARALKGWRRLAPGSSRKAYPGAPARLAGVSVGVHATKRALSLSTLVFGSPDGPDQHRVVSSSESRQGRSSQQGRRVRRQPGPGQSLPKALGLRPLQDHQAGAPRGATLGLPVLRLYPLLYEGSGSPVTACESLQLRLRLTAPLRTVHRPQPQPGPFCALDSKRAQLSRRPEPPWGGVKL